MDAQNNVNEEPIIVSFVKNEIIQNNGELSFNVVRIQNTSDYPIRIQPIIDLPEGWAIFSASMSDTVIQPNSTISLPFRYRTSDKSKSEVEHTISFKAHSSESNILAEKSFIVRLLAFHNWDIIIPDKRVFFYPELDNAWFSIILRNNGNTSENISVDLVIDRKISLEGIHGNNYFFTINLPANSDTTIRFNAIYSHIKDRVFDISKVQIHASSQDKKIYRAVILEKYSDTYAPFEVDRTLAHETEVGTRTFSQNNETLPFVRARGVTTFKNDSRFRYNFTYYDITRYEDVISNSYYNLLYTWDKFNVGVGAFSSTLGRNLYGRNCLMVSNEFRVNDYSNIEAYASYGLTSPKANIAAAYRYTSDDVNIKGSLSYDVDSYNNRNTGSAVLNSGRISLFKNHEIRLSLFGYQEIHQVKNVYQQIGYAWDFNYFGKITKKLTLQFSNNYGSPDIPGPQMGLLNFYSKLKFTPGNEKNYVSITYVNSSRDYYHVDREGIRLPNILLKDQYANLLFHNNSHKKARWYIGPSIEFFNSSHPHPSNTSRILYDVDKYRMEFKGYFGKHLTVNVKYGFGIMDYQDEIRIKETVHDFHILSDYSNNGYGLRVSYDYGPMVNMGLYQYALDAGNNSFSISPYMLRTFLSGRIGVSLFTNYTHRFDLKYGSLNINPKIETYVYKNWYAVVGGTYNYTQQSYGEFDSKHSFHYVELSIKKKWGNSDYYKWRKDLRRLKVQLFQDDNGNGSMDRGEEGIRNVKVRIQLSNTADASAREKFPVDITLMSNDKGIVTFTRIPKGFYKVTIVPLNDLNEYFYINNTSDIIELNKNAIESIPFQKANKIVGRVEMKRHQFISETDETIQLGNIKVTAYSNKGDSYSTFTRSDGSFTVFAPGNNVYFVRIKNVFGKDFAILNNDARRELVDSISTPILIRVVENKRKINFKKANNPNQGAPDLQKIKVLPGKIYENSNNKAVDINSIPDFHIPDMQVEIEEIIAGRFYLVAGEFNNIKDAERALKILQEQGVNGKIGLHGDPTIFYITIENTVTREEANEKLRNYRRVGLTPIKIKKIKEQSSNQ